MPTNSPKKLKAAEKLKSFFNKKKKEPKNYNDLVSNFHKTLKNN